MVFGAYDSYPVYRFDTADDECGTRLFQFEVDPQYHSKIIGAKGAVISRIRTDHNVRINLPRRDDPDNSTISILGLEANALAARDEILQIVDKHVSWNLRIALT